MLFVSTLLADTDLKLGGVVRRLVDVYQPRRIYLFGSVARGDAGPDSDYDLLILVPDDAPPAHRSSRVGYQALRGTGVAADVIVWTESAFHRRAAVPSSLPAIVLREGKVLHDA